jgi:hypothetical protein
LRLPIVIWGVGILAVVTFGTALGELLTSLHPPAPAAILTGIGVFAALTSMAILIWGAQRRFQLIYEFHQSVLDLAAQVKAYDNRWSVDEEGEWLVRIPEPDEAATRVSPLDTSEGLTRNEILDLIEAYESSLSGLGAFAEASDARVLAETLRYRYAGGPDVLPRHRQ